MKRNAVYQAARWAYQPIKAAKSKLRWLGAPIKRRRAIKRANSGTFVGIQVGTGFCYLDGWINTDLPPDHPDVRIDMPMDISRRMPLADGFAHAIYASEVIEHVDRDVAAHFLREAHRVLNSKGVLRLTTPNIEAICAIYLGTHPVANLDLYRRHWICGDFTRDIWINAAFRWHGHQFLYSLETLTNDLQSAGFRRVVSVSAQETASPYPQLACIERHFGSAPKELYALSLIVEAFK